MKRAIEAAPRGTEDEPGPWIRDIRALCLFGLTEPPDVRAAVRATLDREEEWIGPHKVCPWAQASYLPSLWQAGEVPDSREVLIDSLRWAVEMARTPEMNGRATGLAAYQAWADDMLRDQDFPADDPERIGDITMSIGDNFVILFDARRAGARYLERSAEQVGEQAAEHGMNCQRRRLLHGSASSGQPYVWHFGQK